MTSRVTTALGLGVFLKNVSLQRWVYGFLSIGLLGLSVGVPLAEA